MKSLDRVEPSRSAEVTELSMGGTFMTDEEKASSPAEKTQYL